MWSVAGVSDQCSWKTNHRDEISCWQRKNNFKKNQLGKFWWKKNKDSRSQTLVDFVIKSMMMQWREIGTWIKGENKSFRL